MYIYIYYTYSPWGVENLQAVELILLTLTELSLVAGSVFTFQNPTSEIHATRTTKAWREVAATNQSFVNLHKIQENCSKSLDFSFYSSK
jgi:hypothetical protein